MREMNKPEENITEVYNICISEICNDEIKEKFKDCLPEIEEDELSYISYGRYHELHKLKSKDEIKGISKKEFENLYKYRMLNKEQPGRQYYNKFLNSVSICPYCGVRDVWTLDHYLPKSKYPSYVITPINLIPSCRECNSTKDTYEAGSKKEELWHPYFDSFFGKQWLYADVIETEPPAFVFYMKIPNCFKEDEDAERIRKHFEVLHLGKLYSIQAANELTNISRYLKQLFIKAGANAVKQHLDLMYDSYKSNNTNSWQTAMYFGLCNSPWFINTWINQ